jgi:uncharacterized SAM-binding protein YcdF (DUF218 family)
MSWMTTNLIATLLLPPLSLFLLLGLGMLLFYRHPKTARALLGISFGLLWLCSTPYFAEGALHLLEARTSPLHLTPTSDATSDQAEAIVILGGGSYFHAPEYAGQDTVNDQTLPRLRYGAKLHRDAGYPILVTGGKPRGNTLSEAQQMRAALQQDFQVPVRWAEDASDNTLENARYSYQTLHKAGIVRIYLVTHAWHMPRSATAFRQAGFTVIEAPTAFTTRYQIDLLAFLPRAEALHGSKIFVHELIGLLWYRIKSAIIDTPTN